MKFNKIICAAQVEKLAEVTEFVEGCADRCGLDAQKKFGLLVAVEEAFVNICHYAYPDEAGEVVLSCGADGDAFVLEIADKGRPFDVLARPDPDTILDIIDRKIGGMGIHLLRKLSDSVSYRRENDQNILRLVFQRT